MTEERIMLIQIVETVEDVPSTFVHTCHPDGVRSTTLELPPELVLQLHAAMLPVYEKHRQQCHEAMKRSWKLILEGRGRSKFVEDYMLLAKAEKEEREKARRNSKEDK